LLIPRETVQVRRCMRHGSMSPARIPVRFVMEGGPGWWSRNAYGFEPEYAALATLEEPEKIVIAKTRKVNLRNMLNLLVRDRGLEPLTPTVSG
jgi:hypothetical protein